MTDKLDYRIPLTLDVVGELATAYLLMSPPAPFEYHFQQNGNTVGKLIIDCGRVSFEGDADAAAATFIEALRARWSRQWQEQERALRDCRRSAQLSLERVAELERQPGAAAWYPAEISPDVPRGEFLDCWVAGYVCERDYSAGLGQYKSAQPLVLLARWGGTELLRGGDGGWSFDERLPDEGFKILAWQPIAEPDFPLETL